MIVPMNTLTLLCAAPDRLAALAALRALGCANLRGAIVGKALYEGTVTLPEMLAAAQAG